MQHPDPSGSGLRAHFPLLRATRNKLPGRTGGLHRWAVLPLLGLALAGTSCSSLKSLFGYGPTTGAQAAKAAAPLRPTAYLVVRSQAKVYTTATGTGTVGRLAGIAQLVASEVTGPSGKKGRLRVSTWKDKTRLAGWVDASNLMPIYEQLGVPCGSLPWRSTSHGGEATGELDIERTAQLCRKLGGRLPVVELRAGEGAAGDVVVVPGLVRERPASGAAPTGAPTGAPAGNRPGAYSGRAAGKGASATTPAEKRRALADRTLHVVLVVDSKDKTANAFSDSVEDLCRPAPEKTDEVHCRAWRVEVSTVKAKKKVEATFHEMRTGAFIKKKELSIRGLRTRPRNAQVLPLADLLPWATETATRQEESTLAALVVVALGQPPWMALKSDASRLKDYLSRVKVDLAVFRAPAGTSEKASSAVQTLEDVASAAGPNIVETVGLSANTIKTVVRRPVVILRQRLKILQKSAAAAKAPKAPRSSDDQPLFMPVSLPAGVGANKATVLLKDEHRALERLDRLLDYLLGARDGRNWRPPSHDFWRSGTTILESAAPPAPFQERCVSPISALHYDRNTLEQYDLWADEIWLEYVTIAKRRLDECFKAGWIDLYRCWL